LQDIEWAGISQRVSDVNEPRLVFSLAASPVQGSRPWNSIPLPAFKNVRLKRFDELPDAASRYRFSDG